MLVLQGSDHSLCPRRLCCWASSLSRRRAEHFTDLSLPEEAILCNGFPVLSVAFNKEALFVSNPLSGSAERHSYLSELVLFSPLHALCLHQCTLALRLSQPLWGDLFPVRKGETGSNSKGHRDQLQQGCSEHTVQTNVNTGVTIVLMDRL